MAQSIHQQADTQHAHQTKPAKPVVEQAPALALEAPVADAVQARVDPRAMTPRNIAALQRTVGNRAVQRLIQRKLTVNAPGDQYEQEADQVANQVMTMRDPVPVQRQGMPEEDELQMMPLVERVQRAEEDELQMKPLVQRAAEEDELQAKPLIQRHDDELQAKPLVQREDEAPEEEIQEKPLAASVQREDEAPEEEIQEKPAIQRASHDGGFETNDAFTSRVQTSRGGGSPLPDETRDFMESRMGADFDGVRVHTGGEAAQLSREVQAQAFTQGSDIYFNEGKYNPHSSDGKQLLAHELTHTVQQGASGAQRHVQRHPEGAGLQHKDAQVAEIGAKEQLAPEKTGNAAAMAPSATRTKTEETTEKSAGKDAGTAFTKSQKLTPGAMSLASAEKILQGAFGGVKKIVPGSVVILADQPACSAKYDEVCMADNILHNGSPWKAGDCALDDAAAGVTTEGFAWKGVAYVNGATALVTATAHEILHNNTESNFRAKVGETFNEGVTETLARKALTDAGVRVPSVTAYPAQVKLTKLLIDLVGIDVVQKAYFEDVQGLVQMYLRKGSSTWGKLVEAAEALDTDKVKAAVKPGFGA